MQNTTKPKGNKKIIVGMSGGVDSSVALMLLKNQGWEPIGVSLKLPVWQSKKNCLKENVCCTQQSFRIAKDICKKMGVKHFIVNASKDFKEEVINYFIYEYKNNRTPNPCVICNRVLKFQKLFEAAKIYGANFVATGHYAKIKFDQKTGEYGLWQSKDENKDQTYSLSNIKREWLERIIFPLADFKKEEVYKIAKAQGFNYFEKQKQSQDFCFVANKSFPNFLAKEIGIHPGNIIDKNGKILGRHKGLHFYTIGQRKGIGLSGGPYFVVDFDQSSNSLIVSSNTQDSSKKEILLDNCNFLVDIKFPMKCQVKIRARSELFDAKILKVDEPGMFKIVFLNISDAPTPGQYCVFYKSGRCLGGGRIRSL